MVWYGMVWYGTVRYGIIWYGIVWYATSWYGMVWYRMVRYDTVWYGMIWYDMVLCDTVACVVHGELLSGDHACDTNFVFPHCCAAISGVAPEQSYHRREMHHQADVATCCGDPDRPGERVG